MSILENTRAMPERKCPICDHYQPIQLHKQRFCDFSDGALLNGYDVVACSHCGLVYADKIPPSAKFADYYRDHSKYEYAYRSGVEHQEETARLENLAAWIVQGIDPTRSIVDMGCGTGTLLRLLRQGGFRKLAGLDPSPVCCENARVLSGCDVINSEIGPRPKGVERVNAVVLSAVLEHVVDIRQCIADVETWLTDDGSIVVEVPNAAAFTKVANAPFQEFSTEHINFFSPESLCNLLSVCGFEVEATSEAECPVGPGVTGQVARILAKRTGVTRPVVFTQTALEAVKAYVGQCQLQDVGVARMCDQLLTLKTPVYVWGIGTLCQRLLAEGLLSPKIIAAFVDSNSQVQGKSIFGKAVLAPAKLPDDGLPVVVMSRQFSSEIVRTVRELSKRPREIILVPAA